MAPLSSLDFGQMPLSRGASLTWSSDYEPDVKPIIIIIINTSKINTYRPKAMYRHRGAGSGVAGVAAATPV